MSKTRRTEPTETEDPRGNPMPASVAEHERRERSLEKLDLMHELSHAGPATWSDWTRATIARKVRRGELVPRRLNLGAQGGETLMWWAGSFYHEGTIYTVGGYVRAHSTRAWTRELDRRGYIEALASRRPLKDFGGLFE